VRILTDSWSFLELNSFHPFVSSLNGWKYPPLQRPVWFFVFQPPQRLSPCVWVSSFFFFPPAASIPFIHRNSWDSPCFLRQVSCSVFPPPRLPDCDFFFSAPVIPPQKRFPLQASNALSGLKKCCRHGILSSRRAPPPRWCSRS